MAFGKLNEHQLLVVIKNLKIYSRRILTTLQSIKLIRVQIVLYLKFRNWQKSISFWKKKDRGEFISFV